MNGKRKNITKVDLLVIGESIRCKKTLEFIGEINNMVNQRKSYANEVEVSPAIRSIGGILLNLTE